MFASLLSREGFGSGGGGGAPSGFYRHNAQDIDPEELFNMFFGGSPFGHTTHFHTARGFHQRRRRPSQGGAQDVTFNLGAIMQLLPLERRNSQSQTAAQQFRR